MNLKYVLLSVAVLVSLSVLADTAWDTIRSAGTGVVCADGRDADSAARALAAKINHANRTKSVGSQPVMAIAPDGKVNLCVTLNHVD